MLKRKIRKIGSSLVISIPMQIAKVYGYREGMMLAVDMERDVIIFKKTKK